MVSQAADDAKTLFFQQPSVWVSFRQNRGVRLPQGVYPLEAEDADYLYFRAPGAIEVRARNGEQWEGPEFTGGVALARSLLTLPPAVVYVDSGPNLRMHVWKLGGEFMETRGTIWEKRF